MCLNKLKNITKQLKKQTSNILYVLILAIFLASTIRPATVEANSGKIDSFLAYFSQESSDNNTKTELIIREAPGIRPRTAKLPEKPKPNSVITAVITAYTSTVDQTDGDPFTAASGKQVYDGMIAANWLPFGTKIKIPALYGDKEFTVDDRMNERFGYGRMDIWLDAERQVAINFGVKVVEIEVYYKPRTVRLSMVGE